MVMTSASIWATWIVVSYPVLWKELQGMFFSLHHYTAARYSLSPYSPRPEEIFALDAYVIHSQKQIFL